MSKLKYPDCKVCVMYEEQLKWAKTEDERAEVKRLQKKHLLRHEDMERMARRTEKAAG